MANLTWIKAAQGYKAETKHGTYYAQRSTGGKFQLVVDGHDLSQPRTLTGVKYMAQGLEDGRIKIHPAYDPEPATPTIPDTTPMTQDELVELCGSDMAAAASIKAECEQRPDPTPTTAGGTVATVKSAATAQQTSAGKTLSPLQAKLAQRGNVLAERKAVSVPTAPHVIVEARAGSGKTTTLIEGLKVVKGLTPTIIPSPQQQAVWDQMAKSQGVRTVCFCAFNKSIAQELQQRVPAGCQAMTLHSLGFSAVRRAFSSVKVNEYRVEDIISELLDKDIRDLRKYSQVLLKATKDLVGLCKMNLTDPTETNLAQLASHYEIDTTDDRKSYRTEVFELVPRVLERCKDLKDNCIDFSDMVWLPVALDLPVFQNDLLLVDEAQDLNRCQQALAMKAGKRLILCGDPRQAIYGFAGADAESMPRMTTVLSGMDAGCVILPLTVTRRCGKAIVKEANAIVPEFYAHESNPEGVVKEARMASKTYTGPTYHDQAADGDMVLCRVNAPLVSECFRFIRMGRKANIQGRDVAAGLISTINKLKAVSLVQLVEKISDWLHKEKQKEQAKRNPSESKLIALQDRADCILCFTEGAATVEDVIARINSVFTDDGKAKGIRLSSIHKSKGLEADRVFLLEPEGATVPHPMAKSPWQYEQELNLRYVAITRAIHELVYVS